VNTTAVLHTVTGVLLLAIGISGLHTIITRSAPIGPAPDDAPAPDGVEPGSGGAGPPASGSFVALMLFTVTGLLLGSFLLAALGLAGQPVAYEVLFGVTAVALAAFGYLRPAAARPRRHLSGRTFLLACVPLLLLTGAIGLSWWSDSTTTHTPVTALGAVRTQEGLKITVTRSGSDTGDLRLEVIGPENRPWRSPALPSTATVDVTVGPEISPAGPTTVRLLTGEEPLRSVTVP
jgi:hypothetical protein